VAASTRRCGGRPGAEGVAEDDRIVEEEWRKKRTGHSIIYPKAFGTG
jgi:hypothetical protein